MTSPVAGLPPMPPVNSPAWAGWFSSALNVLVATSSSGPTSGRPTSGLYIGRFYFDTTLGIAIWCKTPGSSPVWVNGAGTPV